MYSSTLIDIFKNSICAGSIVISDSQRSYHELINVLNIKCVKILSCEKSKDGYTLEMVNHLRDRIKAFFRDKRNVMIHYLQRYLALFQYSELHTMMIGRKRFQDEFMKIIVVFEIKIYAQKSFYIRRCMCVNSFFIY